jgi:hypothetical protein
MGNELAKRAFETFHHSGLSPAITLRSGDALDGYSAPIPYDAELDQPTSHYLEQYSSGIAFLDPSSWQYYLPYLTEYALENLGGSQSLVVDHLLFSLRPPEREPPRLASLTKEQEKVIVDLLEVLAFDPRSVYQAEACQVLEEYWIPGALYRRG